MLSRREAFRSLVQFFLASPLLRAQNRSAAAAPLLDLVNTFDFAKLAKSKLDPLAWDYLDEVAEDESSLHDSREAFKRIILRPRFLTDVHKIDLSTSFLGKKLNFPIFIDPAGGKNCFCPNGEEEVAKAAAASGAMMITNGGIERFLTSGKGPKNWWQLTTGEVFRTKNTSLDVFEKLEDMGASGVCFTVDHVYRGHRERSVRNKFVRVWCETRIPRDAQGKLIRQQDEKPDQVGVYSDRPFPNATWDTVRRFRDMTKLPFILKGILTAEDTAKSVQAGASAVVVSSHGGRQLDYAGGTIEALPECVRAAGGKIPVLIDGGFRRGTDLLKALALGAKAVGVARPYLWGLTCFGQRGVSRVVELLRTELANDMGLAGVTRISDIDRSLVRIRS
jgi:isopentenyl diphosphate isomerase/L-lactate dehydrogenase-like FMN-dependent dehydrogenase